MDSTKDLLIKKAYANPSLRQNIFNKGTVFLYCDYAGYTEHNVYGVACCVVYNRTISVSSKKLQLEQDRGSNYGELLAIAYSLELLTTALMEHQPKVAIIFTDCSSISRILSKLHFPHQDYEYARDEILDSLGNLKTKFPQVDVSVKYISKHKKKNHLHRMAHNEARQVANKLFLLSYKQNKNPINH